MSLLKKCTIDDKDEEYKASNSALRLIGAICFSPNQFWIEELLKGVKNTPKKQVLLLREWEKNPNGGCIMGACLRLVAICGHDAPIHEVTGFDKGINNFGDGEGGKGRERM